MVLGDRMVCHRPARNRRGAGSQGFSLASQRSGAGETRQIGPEGLEHAIVRIRPAVRLHELGPYALKWLPGHPAITAAIPGSDNPQDMTDNLKAGAGRLPNAAMRRKMAEAFDAL